VHKVVYDDINIFLTKITDNIVAGRYFFGIGNYAINGKILIYGTIFMNKQVIRFM
jgi:hypothetical protein